MRVIVCPEFGPPENLIVEDRPDPIPGQGEVLVRHRAWGLNYVDLLMCAGGYQLKPRSPLHPWTGGRWRRRGPRPGRDRDCRG